MGKSHQAKRLTDDIVARLPPPETGHQIFWDAPDPRGRGWVAGFGCRVTAAGARSFILDYRTHSGKQRRFTIGKAAAWSVTAARDEAKELRAKVDQGLDPQGNKAATRSAPTVNQLCDDFIEKHLPSLRQRTAQEYRRMIESNVRPALGTSKVADVTYDDIQSFHRKITQDGAPYVANRLVSILGKMFNLASRQWKWRSDNPVRGIQRNPEIKRKRYLTPEESARLRHALAEYERKGPEAKDAANILRLLLLTGARKGEVLAMRWDQLDLKAGKWTKPAHATKQKTEHEVPLSGPARLILAGIRAETDANSEFVFSGRTSGHRHGITRNWRAVCKAANISGARMHDLRHSYASFLASRGFGLTTVGQLLGHSNPTTTARYAHLYDDHLREATEQAGEIFGSSRRRKAKVVPFRRRGRK
jgi:integrase